MTAEPWLSAVVPNYNDASLLPRAIAALMRQDPAPDEIIVVDDGSTDDSLAVIERLGREVPGLRLIRHERNVGVIAALNRGIAAARGRLLYLGSANDTIESGFFDLARRMLDAHPDSGFFCGECRIVDAAGNELAIRPPARPSHKLTHFPPQRVPALFEKIDNFTPSSAVVLKRAAVEAEGRLLPELGSFADGYLMRCLALSHGFCFAPTVVANWTVNPGGASLTTAGRPETALGVLKNAQARMRMRDIFPPSYPELFARRWRFGIGRVAAGEGRDVLVSLAPVVAPGRAERAVWGGLARVPGHAGRLARLSWLTLRFRPFSLVAIAFTQIARWHERNNAT
ncbi:MAG: glycosyltransferase family 2 protein [Inquilinaceae bacterium]